MPATLSIISNVFDPRERAKAIGVWAGAVGLAVAIGPIVGRPAAGAVLVGLGLPDQRADRDRRPDRDRASWCPSRATRSPAGSTSSASVLSIVGLVLLVYGIIDGGEHGFDRPRAWGTIAAGALVLAAFVWYESPADAPVARRAGCSATRRSPPRSARSAWCSSPPWASFFFTAFYLQLVRGYTPLQTGLLLLPFAAAQLIFAPRSAALVRRFGPKAVCAAGLLLVTAALVGMALFEVDTPLWIVGVTLLRAWAPAWPT